MKLVEIGKTEEGRPQWMAILTSPKSKKLDHYKEIARRLALAEGLAPRPHASARRQSGRLDSTAACTPPRSSAPSSSSNCLGDGEPQ